MTTLPRRNQRLFKHLFNGAFIVVTALFICVVSLTTGWGLDGQALDTHAAPTLALLDAVVRVGTWSN